jgi:type IV pilus assembly protein PilA
MNNKGVTLVELLIVIVVLGIISAFAIPAVGTIIENAEKSSVYNDALMIENAAKLYCQDNYEVCEDSGFSNTLAWEDIYSYVDGINNGTYNETTDITDTDTIATRSGSEWTVSITSDGATSDYGYSGVPSVDGKGNVNES